MRWSSVSETERASGASADDRTRNCGSETRGVTLARRSRGGRVLFTLHNTFECSLGGGGTSFVPQFTLPVLSGSPPFWFNPRLVLSALAIGLGCDLLAPVGHCGEWSRSIIDNYKRRSPAWSSFLCGPRGPDLLSTTCPPPTPKAAVTPRPSYATAATTKATRCAPWPSDRQDPIYTTPPATSSWAAKTRAGSRPPPASFRKADTHLKRVVCYPCYAFKAAALRGPQNERPGSDDACGDGRSSRGVVVTARDGASSVRAGRRWRTSFVSESLVRPPESVAIENRIQGTKLRPTHPHS